MLYIEYDFQEGGDLRNLLDFQLDQNIKMDQHAIQKYFAQIVIGLSQLHSNGFIYKDLKPENILIGKNGDLVLTDFEYSLHIHLDIIDILIILIAHYSEKFKYDLNLIKKNQSKFPDNIFVSNQNELIFKTRNICLNFNQNDQLKIENLKTFFKINLLKNNKLSFLSNQITTQSLSLDKTNKKYNLSSDLNLDSLDNTSFKNLTNFSDKKFISKLEFKFCKRGGSTEFMAPESIWKKLFSFSSDLWSLGCILYDLSFGYSLFNFKGIAKNPIKIVNQINKILESDKFFDNLKKVPLEVRDIILKLLRINPEKRSYSLNCSQILKHSWFKSVILNIFEQKSQPFLPFPSAKNDSKSPFYIYNIKYKKNPEFKLNETFLSGFKSTTNTNQVCMSSQNNFKIVDTGFDNNYKFNNSLDFIDVMQYPKNNKIKIKKTNKKKINSRMKSLDNMNLIKKSHRRISIKKKYRLKKKKMKTSILSKKSNRKSSPFKKKKKKRKTIIPKSKVPTCRSIQKSIFTKKTNFKLKLNHKLKSDRNIFLKKSNMGSNPQIYLLNEHNQDIKNRKNSMRQIVRGNSSMGKKISDHMLKTKLSLVKIKSLFFKESAKKHISKKIKNKSKIYND